VGVQITGVAWLPLPETPENVEEQPLKIKSRQHKSIMHVDNESTWRGLAPIRPSNAAGAATASQSVRTQGEAPPLHFSDLAPTDVGGLFVRLIPIMADEQAGR
jgi:hypothetical protein